MRFTTALLIIGLLVGATRLEAAVPSNPSNLVATVSGSSVALSWTGSSAPPAMYIVQAGYSAGDTVVTLPVDGLTTQLAVTAPAGTYFVRVVAQNAEGQSLASNEVIVTVDADTGCALPAAPVNVRGTVKDSELYLAWNNVAGAASFIVQAGVSPGTTFQTFPVTARTLNASVGAGTFYVRVVAVNACGSSGPSEEIALTFPGNSVRVADPAAGSTLPLPDVEGLIRRIGAERPDLMAASCPGGEASKYILNPFINYVVDRLREYDTRWGYNAKPTRTPAQNGGLPVVAAGDEVAYFAGAGDGEGSAEVFLIDVLFGHCGPNPEVTFRHFTGQEPGIWTGAGRFLGQ